MSETNTIVRTVVKESWLEKKPTEGNLISHVLEIRRRLATMQQIVKTNLEHTQRKQKHLYYAHSSRRRLEVGDKALVLIQREGPSLSCKFEGPYPTLEEER